MGFLQSRIQVNEEKRGGKKSPICLSWLAEITLCDHYFLSNGDKIYFS